MALVDGEKEAEEVTVALVMLQEAYDEVVRVNARYMEVERDKAPEALTWEVEVTTRYLGCWAGANNYSKRDGDSFTLGSIALDASTEDIFMQTAKNQQNVLYQIGSSGITIFSMGQDEYFRVDQVKSYNWDNNYTLVTWSYNRYNRSTIPK